MGPGNIKTCYISAPADVNLEPLLKVLYERDISVSNPGISYVGEPLVDTVGSHLKNVDLVIGILSRERRSDWILFELGVAWSNKRQILLVVPPGASFVPPWDMPGLLVVRANPSSVEAIGFALDQLRAAPPREISPPVPATFASLGQSADVLLKAARTAVEARNGKAFEDVIETALEGAHLDGIAREISSKDARPDFAVWVDALASTVGNPLLIEVKLQLSNRSSMRMAATKLSQAVLATDTRFGLLLYGDGPPSDQVDRDLPFNVLALSATELLENLRTHSFATIISHLRNRRVHGVAY